MYSGFNFIDEKTLKEKFVTKGKIVDFLVIEERASIFIDAKGVELAFLGMVSDKAEVVKDKTRRSVIKAIMQAYETATSLASAEAIRNLVLEKEKFLLVVTGKDFYLGNGQDFYNEIANVAKVKSLLKMKVKINYGKWRRARGRKRKSKQRK